MIHAEKILVIKLRAIGDVVLSTIVLENLARAFPQAAMDFLTEPAPAAILSKHPALRRVWILDRTARRRSEHSTGRWAMTRLLRSLRAERYDLVFDFFGNPRSALITWVSGAHYRVGYDYRVRRLAYSHVVRSRAREVHEADWHLDALTALEIPIVSRRLQVAFGPEEVQFAEAFLHQLGWPDRRVAVINFSGGWAAKRWPLPRFAELCETLAAAYPFHLAAIWGPGERQSADQLCRMALTSGIVPAPATSLTQLAALLQRAAIMVTTDSGPMHIAAAVGTPCVAIFGPTDPELQGPYGSQHTVVRNTALSCLACNRTTCDHVRCMEQLPVASVFQAVKECVAKNKLLPG
ncbi:MAG TPA: glycosyltransferase family 9 protein [bacterium]|nr:glycosyltransferase family 9 protein [bacterium]HPN34802.1 glycosyltransferase family 9 protein [bacterium]